MSGSKKRRTADSIDADNKRLSKKILKSLADKTMALQIKPPHGLASPIPKVDCLNELESMFKLFNRLNDFIWSTVHTLISTTLSRTESIQRVILNLSLALDESIDSAKRTTSFKHFLGFCLIETQKKRFTASKLRWPSIQEEERTTWLHLFTQCLNDQALAFNQLCSRQLQYYLREAEILLASPPAAEIKPNLDEGIIKRLDTFIGAHHSKLLQTNSDSIISSAVYSYFEANCHAPFLLQENINLFFQLLAVKISIGNHWLDFTTPLFNILEPIFLALHDCAISPILDATMPTVLHAIPLPIEKADDIATEPTMAMLDPLDSVFKFCAHNVSLTTKATTERPALVPRLYLNLQFAASFMITDNEKMGYYWQFLKCIDSTTSQEAPEMKEFHRLLASHRRDLNLAIHQQLYHLHNLYIYNKIEIPIQKLLLFPAIASIHKSIQNLLEKHPTAFLMTNSVDIIKKLKDLFTDNILIPPSLSIHSIEQFMTQSAISLCHLTAWPEIKPDLLCILQQAFISFHDDRLTKSWFKPHMSHPFYTATKYGSAPSAGAGASASNPDA